MKWYEVNIDRSIYLNTLFETKIWMSYNVDERVFSFFTESESTRTKNELYGSFAIQSVHKARSYITDKSRTVSR